MIKLLTAKEAAKLLQIHRITLHRWIKAGQIVRFGYAGRSPRFGNRICLKR